MGKLERLEAICPLFVDLARQAVRSEIRALDRGRIAQAHRVHDGSGVVGRRDFGPAIRAANNQVVAEYRADPDPAVGALIHGGRVRDGLQMMYRAQRITIQQWHAGCRFRDDLDLAAGARLITADQSGVRSASPGAVWPGDVQLDSLQRVRAIWRLLQGGHTAVVAAVVVRGATTSEFAREQRIRKATAGELFHEAIDLILAYYDDAENGACPPPNLD